MFGQRLRRWPNIKPTLGQVWVDAEFLAQLLHVTNVRELAVFDVKHAIALVE